MKPPVNTLITGAGIGRATALRFAEAGSNLAICSRTESEIDRTAEDCRKLGVKVLHRAVSVADEAAITQFCQDAIKEFGYVDCLVTNAADFLRGSKPVLELSTDDLRRILDTNLFGVLYCTKALLPCMLERKEGTICMISSVAGKRANAGGAAYGASKFALNGLAMSLLYEVRKQNVRVVVVSPSAVELKELPPHEIKEKGPGAYQRMEDIAEAIYFSCALPNRCLVRDIELWGTNPFAE